MLFLKCKSTSLKPDNYLHVNSGKWMTVIRKSAHLKTWLTCTFGVLKRLMKKFTTRNNMHVNLKIHKFLEKKFMYLHYNINLNLSYKSNLFIILPPFVMLFLAKQTCTSVMHTI